MLNINRSASMIPQGGMTKVERVGRGLRQCKDIGLWVIDNGCGNCKFRTPACDDCYNRKMLRFVDMRKAWAQGGLDDQNWAKATPESFKGLSRVRLNTRGEAFSSLENIDRVADWVAGNPNTKFWMVTRAWQTGKNGSPENWFSINEPFLRAIENKIMVFSNARVMASIDDWTSQHWATLKDHGWSTIYFSKELNTHPALGLEGSNISKCRKTWTKVINENGRPVHLQGVCRNCRTGCFADCRVDVWLKYHQ